MKLLGIFILIGWVPTLLFGNGYAMKQQWTAHQGGVQNLRYSHNGKLIASCGKTDKLVKLWNAETGKLLQTFSGNLDMVHEVSFSNDDKWLASAGKDGFVRVWNTSSGKSQGKFKNEPLYGVAKKPFKSVSFVCFSSDNATLYFGGENGYLNKANLHKPTTPAIRVIQTNTHDLGYIKTITGGAMSPDGKGVMVAIDKFIKVIDIKTGEVTKTFYYPFAYINDVIAIPSQQQISTWSYDGIVTVWDYHSESLIKKLPVTKEGNYSSPSFTYDGAQLVSSTFGNEAKVWDWDNSTHIASLKGHRDIVRVSRFHPSKDFIATASYDGSIKIWHPQTQKAIASKSINKKAPAPRPTFHIVEETKEAKGQMYLFGKPVQPGETIELSNLNFPKGKYELTLKSMEELDIIANFLKQYPSISIEIHGHTDDVGHPILNYELSEKRAIASKNYLMEKGIPSHRIYVKAFGESNPLFPNSTEKTRPLNRRIEIKIIQK